jgi:DNA modification methylase
MGKQLLGSLELNRIYQRDCIEGIRMIPEKSIDLIVIDPPYNIGIKGAEWDKYSKEEYAEFMGNVFRECARILKDNGSFYWFHNDMPQIARLMALLEEHTVFVFNSFITWDKGDWRAISWKNPSEKSNLRSWFNSSEYCLLYTFQDETGVTTARNFIEIKAYLQNEREKAGLKTMKEINELLGLSTTGGGKASNIFGKKETTKPWEFPTKWIYERLQSTGYFQKPYDVLREEYESERFTHNLDESHNNVWRFKTENRGKYHACQKPLSVIERIIKTSSNEGDIVLDCFMGSGTTAVAAVRTGRNFIGFEREPEYVEIANKRLDNELEAR